MPAIQCQSKSIVNRNLIFVLTAVILCGAWLPLAVAGGPERIVAVGDVHGSIEGLTGILEEADVIDSSGRWIGGSMTVVQVGDLLDRGLHLKEVMDLLMRLQVEAPKAGGEVICLLGNHEGMNLLGLVRDVNPEVYVAFVDQNSEKRRNEAWDAMGEIWLTRKGLLGIEIEESSRETWDQWKERFPLGKLEYLEALGPGGMYGKWLRTHKIAVRVGDTLFVHAGLSPALKGQNDREINTRVAAELRHFDRYRAILVSEGLALPTASVNEVTELAARIKLIVREAKGNKGRQLRALAKDLGGATGAGGWYLTHPDGPLWFRGASLGNEQESAIQIAEILDDLKVRRMVVGHTPTRDRNISSRFGGQVLTIDTGMLSEHYEGGRASALEIVGDAVTAIYLGERFRLVDGDWQPVVCLPDLGVAANQ